MFMIFLYGYSIYLKLLFKENAMKRSLYAKISYLISTNQFIQSISYIDQFDFTRPQNETSKHTLRLTHRHTTHDLVPTIHS